MIKCTELIIGGAMKAGTTSLVERISGLKGYATYSTKEPQRYLSKFRYKVHRLRTQRMDKDICWIDGSTDYTKAEFCAESAANFLDLCPSAASVKFIFQIREPIARIVSEINHYVLSGVLAPHTRKLHLAEFPSILKNSFYASNIEPWRLVLPKENILILRYEDMISDDHGYMKKLCEFLDIEEQYMSTTRLPHANASSDRQALPKLVGDIAGNLLYQTWVRQFISSRAKDLVKSKLSRSAPRLYHETDIQLDQAQLESIYSDALVKQHYLEKFPQNR